MKKIFLTLRVALALIAVSSAAPAAFAEGLTQDEREKAVAYLEQTGDEFVKAISSISDAQWSFKPTPERWSIAECAEHITVSEDTVWQAVAEKLMKSPAAPERKSEVAGEDDIILKVIPDRSTKVKAPEMLVPTRRWPSRAELIKHFNERRAKEIAYVRETSDDLRSHFADHPFLKTLDGYQWLMLNGAHCKRHTAQIEEVKTDPGYPKS